MRHSRSSLLALRFESLACSCSRCRVLLGGLCQLQVPPCCLQLRWMWQLAASRGLALVVYLAGGLWRYFGRAGLVPCLLLSLPVFSLRQSSRRASPDVAGFVRVVCRALRVSWPLGDFYAVELWLSGRFLFHDLQSLSLAVGMLESEQAGDLPVLTLLAKKKSRSYSRKRDSY